MKEDTVWKTTIQTRKTNVQDQEIRRGIQGKQIENHEC